MSFLNILQINAADRGGGAAKVVCDLFQGYVQLGHFWKNFGLDVKIKQSLLWGKLRVLDS